MRHEMHLHPHPFEQIKEGTKTIEIRLNDEKRRQIKAGDKIEFTSRSEPEEKIMTKVVEILHFPTFSELFDTYPPEAFGATSKEELMGVYKYYTTEEEKQYGVVGIKIKYLGIPQIIKDVGFDFDWSEEKVWALDVPTEEIDIHELTWHFDIPFLWEDGIYNLKPQDVIDEPEKHKEEYDRTMKADLIHPIDIMQNKGHWLILDGLHRLIKASILNMQKVQVRKISRELIPQITK
jgi:ASC-1-like (ASCH) protein